MQASVLRTSWICETDRSILHHRNIDANGKGPISVPLRSLMIRNVIIKKAEAREINDQLSVLMENNYMIHLMIGLIRFVIIQKERS